MLSTLHELGDIRRWPMFARVTLQRIVFSALVTCSAHTVAITCAPRIGGY
jgi:hypothetical protein